MPQTTPACHVPVATPAVEVITVQVHICVMAPLPVLLPNTAMDRPLRPDHSAGRCGRWAVAQAATTAANMIAYPFDTVRRRLMMQVCVPWYRSGG